MRAEATRLVRLIEFYVATSLMTTHIFWVWGARLEVGAIVVLQTLKIRNSPHAICSTVVWCLRSTFQGMGTSCLQLLVRLLKNGTTRVTIGDLVSELARLVNYQPWWEIHLYPSFQKKSMVCRQHLNHHLIFNVLQRLCQMAAINICSSTFILQKMKASKKRMHSKILE